MGLMEWKYVMYTLWHFGPIPTVALKRWHRAQSETLPREYARIIAALFLEGRIGYEQAMQGHWDDPAWDPFMMALAPRRLRHRIARFERRRLIFERARHGWEILDRAATNARLQKVYWYHWYG